MKSLAEIWQRQDIRRMSRPMKFVPKSKAPFFMTAWELLKDHARLRHEVTIDRKLKLADFCDLQVNQAFVVDAHQLWKQKVELKDWLEGCFAANLAHLGTRRNGFRKSLLAIVSLSFPVLTS